MTKYAGTVTIYRTYFLFDDIADGDVPQDDVREDVYENISASDAARLLEREGLSFAATGDAYAADPDGSYTVDYSTGRECMTSAHLSDFPGRLALAIMQKVG